jgi:hypothetical protein
MADKRNILDRKTLDRYRKQITDDFENNYKDQLVKEFSNKVTAEVRTKFNKEFKDQIIDEVTTDVKEEVKNQIVKEEKKISRGKSFKIFRLSVYIIVLLSIIIYVAYRLYKTDNLDIINYTYTKPEETKEVTTTAPKKEEEKVDYLALYGNLVNTFKVYDYNLYKNNPKVDDLSMITKLQMAYSKLKESDIETDGSILTIKSSTLRSAYIELFGKDDYEPTSFNIYNINFIYSPNKNEYIAIVSVPNTEDVAYHAFDASEDDNYIIVKAYVAKIDNNKVFNIINNRQIGEYNNDIVKYANRLTVVTFRFTKDKNFYSMTVE